MEQWVPLFDIFLKSPTPEVQASLWLQQSFNASSSSSSKPSITTNTFLSLLTKPIDAILNNSTKRVMFIQTLPDMVQSRILSFLAYERERFCKRDLCKLARSILIENKQEIDFWVKTAARNLLDALSGTSNYQWISGFGLDSGEGTVNEEFHSVPGWLRAAASATELSFPWLPLSPDDLNARDLFVGGYGSEPELSSDVGDDGEESLKEVVEEMEIDPLMNASVKDEIQNEAASLRARVMNFESSSKTIELANEIRRLCLEGGGDSFAVLGIIEPWKADDETASVLILHLANGSEDELAWPSQVLSSIILPKMLVLEEPASRLLVTATIEYCKLHQRATEYALLFPLIMRNGGINNPICDVVTRIVKECLHPAHVSALCQRLLCGEMGEKRFIHLPCHKCLVSSELVWTESLFKLFHNVLNHNVQLTQDSVDQLVIRIQELAQKFSNSLKFGNFLLCFITKCALLLKSHKVLLAQAVEQTNTLVTKSMLLKLASF